MIKHWLIPASILVTTPAAAERYLWVSSNETAGFLTAIDLDSVRVVDGHPRAWVVLMLANAATAPAHVPVYIMSLEEFDCKQERSQILASRVFREGGVVVRSLDPEGWQYVVPDTVSYDTLKYGCGKEPHSEQIMEAPVSDIFKIYLDAFRNRDRK